MIIIDAETSGTDAKRNCLLSLGAVDMDSGKHFYGECCMYHFSEIDPVALQINGFTVEEIQPGAFKPWPHQLYAKFLEWCNALPGDPEKRLLGGHNVGHLDVLFLEVIQAQQKFLHHREEKIPKWSFGYRTVDLHTVAFAMWGESLSHEKICERLGLPQEPKPHNALDGAVSEAACFRLLLPIVKNSNIE
jgi:DNA polymerase III epsilon subunit-like protein